MSFIGKRDTSSGDLFTAALDLRLCAKSWEPETCLLGNVTAKQIENIIKDYTRLRFEKGIGDEDYSS